MTKFPVENLQWPEYDMDNPEQVEMAEKADEQRMFEQTRFVADQMSSHSGRAFMAMLLQEADMEGSNFCGEQPYTMAYLEGKEAIGKWAQNLVLTIAPEMFSLMRREVIEREQRYALAAGLETDTHEEE